MNRILFSFFLPLNLKFTKINKLALVQLKMGKDLLLKKTADRGDLSKLSYFTLNALYFQNAHIYLS